MNQDIRLLLIEQARKGEPISYGEIMNRENLNHDSQADRNKLSLLLYQISKFEHQDHRSLLSAMAMYSGFTEHSHGFYELSEEFGLGKKKKLMDEFFAVTQMNECKEFWQNDQNYKLFSGLNKGAKTHCLTFFTREEIEFLNTWAGKVYKLQDQEHIAAKNYIMSSLGAKTVYWSNELVKQLPGFETFNWRMWSQKGWEDTPEGKVRVARFKAYTWARIYKKGDAYKDIFFTVGVDGTRREIVYKLDYYSEANSELNTAQKEIVKKNIPPELRWTAISVTDMERYNWNKLLEKTSSFIAEHAHIYDRVVELAWGKSLPEQAFNNFLRKKDKPLTGAKDLPILNPTFNGVEIDFIQQAIEHKDIGDAGEELVMQYEKNWLSASGLSDLADMVEIVKVGKGYDVLSFKADGSPKYIEVKTTTGNEFTPFIYTINEYLFADRNRDSYIIYRLYNFDDESNTADFYNIEKPFEELLFQPISYRVYFKDPNN